MMAWWATVQSIRWLPYAVGLLLLLLAIWQFSSARYDAGFNDAQAINAEAEKAIMLRHIKQAAQVAKTDLEAVVVTATKKESIRYAYQNIVRTVDTCDSADWLREYNESVRAAGTGSYSSGAHRSPGTVERSR